MNNTRCNLNFFFIIVFLFCNSVTAQIIHNNQEIHTPNASSLGKYGDIPVGLYTGVPDINIPLYTIESGELSLPISLSYHAGGIKVNDVASWVGTGWTLNAGGCISRRVVGVPDEGSQIPAYYIHPPHGYYKDFGPYQYYDYEESNYYIQEGISRGVYDCEPDLFFFNFGKYSGSFFFDSYRQPHLEPMQDIKIEVEFSEKDPSIAGIGRFDEFILTTPDGVKYHFGSKTVNGVTPIEFSMINSLENGNRINASSWLLTKIETASGEDVINFEYEKELFNLYRWSGVFAEFDSDQCGIYNSSYISQKLIKDELIGYRLSKISTKIESIEFQGGLNPRKDIDEGQSFFLQKIKIKSFFDNFFIIDFNYSYKYANMQDSETMRSYSSLPEGNYYRLYLDSVILGNSIDHKQFSFLYNENCLPNRLCLSIDHWGFYNGSYNTLKQAGVPSIKLPEIECENLGSIGGANRQSKWPFSEYGILKSIIYPTGGKTDFSYEPHSYYDDNHKKLFFLTSDFDTGYSGMVWEKEVVSEPITIKKGLKNKIIFSYKLSDDPSSTQGKIKLYSNSVLIEDYTLNESNKELVDISFSLPAGDYIFKMYASSAYGNLKIYQEDFEEPANKEAGGVRISNIKNYSSGELLESKYYSYTEENSNKSSGILSYEPQYIRRITNPVYSNYAQDYIHVYESLKPGRFLYCVSSDHILPMLTNRGSYISYSTVTETDSVNGKKVSYFVNYYDQYYNDQVANTTYPSLPPIKNVETGNLGMERYFNEKKLIKEINYIYDTHYENINSAPGSVSATVYVPRQYIGHLDSEKEGEINYLKTDYIPTIGYSRLKGKNIIQYLPNGIVRDSTVYEYSKNYISNISKEIHYLNDGNSYYNVYSYPKDFLSIPPFECNLYNDYMNNCIKGGANINRESLYNKYVSNVKESLLAYNLKLQNKKTLLQGDLINIYDLYQNNINSVIEQYSTVLNKNGSYLKAKYCSYKPLFSTENQTFKPTKIFDILTCTDKQGFKPAYVYDNNINKDLKYVASYNIEYKDNRIYKQWKEGGIKTYFYYGYKNTYPIIKIDTQDELDVKKFVSNLVPNIDLFLKNEVQNLTTDLQVQNWINFNNRLRSNSFFNNSLLTTYTFNPNFGVSSITDSRNLSTYYKYDDFGRLVNVYDNKKNIINSYRYKW